MDFTPLDANIQSYYTGCEVSWNSEKSARLKAQRGASFEEMLSWPILAVKASPSRSHQDIIYLVHDDYVWLVPCVKVGARVFLKTAFPDRRHTKLWKEKRSE